MGHRERGSIVFILLLGVALFAALSYAVTQAVRTSSGQFNVSDQENMKLAFAELQDVVEAHRLVVRTMLASGISIDDIDASETDTYNVNYYPLSGGQGYRWTNPRCTSNACRLYNPEGGGLRFYAMYKHYPQYTVSGTGVQPNGLFWGWWNRGTVRLDLNYVQLVSRDFCQFINKTLGISTDLDAANNDSNVAFMLQLSGWNRYSMLGSAGQGVGGPGHAEHMIGKNEGCFKDTGNLQYWYAALVQAD